MTEPLTNEPAIAQRLRWPSLSMIRRLSPVEREPSSNSSTPYLVDQW